MTSLVGEVMDKVVIAGWRGTRDTEERRAILFPVTAGGYYDVTTKALWTDEDFNKALWVIHPGDVARFSINGIKGKKCVYLGLSRIERDGDVVFRTRPTPSCDEYYYVTPILPVESPIGIYAFAEKINKSLRISCLADPHPRFQVSFARAEVKSGTMMLESCYGVGPTLVIALNDYINQIVGRVLVFDAMGESRREYLVPHLKYCQDEKGD